jgi:hypothetical protein
MDTFRTKVVRKAIELVLHENDLVFVDLRPLNVLATLNDATLVDFNCSGTVGKVFYPVQLNTDTEWAPGVAAGMPVCKEHDLYMRAVDFRESRSPIIR